MQIADMQSADVEAVSKLVASAYSDALLQLFGRRAVELYRPRTPLELEALRQKFPQGCLVARQGRRITGAIFGRRWGSLGWFSSLAVAPDAQGRGIGKALARAETKLLLESGCSTVGLETWPSAAAYTAMYLSLGFRPVAITAQLIAPTDRQWANPAVSRVLLRSELPASVADAADEAVDRICDKLVDGMSLRVEFNNSDAGSAQRSIWLVKSGDIAGAALIDFSPDFDNTGTHADMWLVVMNPDATTPEDFLALAARAAAEGAARGRRYLNLDVSTDYPATYRFLLGQGFRSASQLLRFVNDGATYQGVTNQAVFNLGRWAT